MGSMHRFSRLALLGLVAATQACGDDLRPIEGEPDAGPPDSPDAGAGPPVIDREQSGGAPTAVELAGDLAFVGLGPRLSIWRMPSAAGDAPQLVGESEPFVGVVTGLAVAGERAFVAERVDLDGRIHVLDISDPARPVETAAFALAAGTPTQPRGMAAAGDRLFVADFEQGVAEVDIADPDDPAPLGLVPMGGVVDLEVVDARLYYVLQSFFGGMSAGALDLEGDLADLGIVEMFGADGAAVSPDNLVVSAGNDGIHVHDMSDPALPVEVFSHILPKGGPFSRAVAVSGTTAWIPAHDGLHLLDLSDPGAIVRTGPLPLPTQGANAAAVAADTLAVVTDRGQLVAFDADVEEPAVRAVVDMSLCADCVGVATAGDRVFAADFSGGLRAGQIEALSLTGSSRQDELIAFEDVAVSGDLAFVADWLFGLRIYDVADPGAPALIGAVDTAGYPSSVAVSGTRVYLGESTNGGALRVIDVTDPAAAHEIGAVATAQARDVEVRGDLAFVADGSLDLPGGLRIFDVSDPARIDLVGYYDGGNVPAEACSEALDVALLGEGSIAVVACSSGGFHIVDVSDPARPAKLARVPAGGISSAWSVTAWEGGAALGHDFGVIVVEPVGSSRAGHRRSAPDRVDRASAERAGRRSPGRVVRPGRRLSVARALRLRESDSDLVSARTRVTGRSRARSAGRSAAAGRRSAVEPPCARGATTRRWYVFTICDRAGACAVADARRLQRRRTGRRR